MKIKLHPRNARDHTHLRKILGTIRWTYNQGVKFLRESKERPTRKLLRSLFINKDSPGVLANPWLEEVGYDIRDDAIKDFLTAMKGNWSKIKKGTIKTFDIHFRSKKRQRSETFYVRKGWISRTDNAIVLTLPKIPPITLWSGRSAWRGPILMDCKFQRTWTGNYYLCVPYEYGVDNQDPKSTKNLKVCSLDPGVRTFQTIYDPTASRVYQVAPNDIQDIKRMCVSLDRLLSKQSKAPRSKRRYCLKRAARRHRTRIQNHVNEVHKQLAKHLATHYDLIMIPKFETTQMVQKSSRKITTQTARQMLCWAHYRFRQRLLFKCHQYGCKVAIVDESWTSKTCSSCGKLNHELGAATSFHCSHCKMSMDRDTNGAKNIFLKNYEALGFETTLGPTPLDPVTDLCTETVVSLLIGDNLGTFEVLGIVED